MNSERIELEDELLKIRPDLNEDDIKKICLFLKECWNYNHHQRIIPEELLKHPLFN